MHVCVRTDWFDSFATTELTTLSIQLPFISPVGEILLKRIGEENTNGISKSREGEYCRQHEQFPST